MDTSPQHRQANLMKRLQFFAPIFMITGLLVMVTGTWNTPPHTGFVGLALLLLGAVWEFSDPANRESFRGHLKYSPFTSRYCYPRGWNDTREQAAQMNYDAAREAVLTLPLDPVERVYFLGKLDSITRFQLERIDGILEEARKVASLHSES